MKPRIVISAVNFVEGGPLSILHDCLSYASKRLTDRYEVVALVHRQSLFNLPQIRFVEFPKAKRSWLLRLYYEYWHFHRVSLELQPLLWLSMHDVTPNVSAKNRAVYCHNPAPFYRLRAMDCWLDPRFAIFRSLYRFIYRININRNNHVIVQQSWLRERFEKEFGVRRILVAYPEILFSNDSIVEGGSGNSVFRFFYPAIPRIFKNYEVICEAVRLLNCRRKTNFLVTLTMDGSESRYSNMIFKRARYIDSLQFIGLKTRGEVFELYKSSDCLIFPSKLETWGMPITEFKKTNRPILAANLEYAHETIGDYPLAGFFEPDDPAELATLMLSVMDGSFEPSKSKFREPEMPFAKGWEGLFEHIIPVN